MSKYDKLVTNAAGRIVPTILNGKPAVPYMGIGKFKPTGRTAAPLIATCADYPDDGNTVVAGLKDALLRSGLKDGRTRSTHHHGRKGERVANPIFDIAKEMGVKDLMWFPSASF